MTAMTSRRRAVLAASGFVVAMVGCVPRAASQLAVFDSPNYRQNLLTSLRALEQINNQVRQLQNEVQMIARLDQNLRGLGPTMTADLQRTLNDIQAQLRSGNGIALRLQATQRGYDQLFPRQPSTTLSGDDVVRNAAGRWEEEYTALRRAALLQGQIADTVDGDARLLAVAMARSKTASGALEVAQAGNELTGLGIKQSLQLQSLLAAHERAQTFARARDLVTEDDARQRFKTFLGSGSGYTASR
jgi:P-type conjugative transfer protein TrbJ